MTLAKRHVLITAAAALGVAAAAGPAWSQTPRAQTPQPVPEAPQGRPSPGDATEPQQGTSTAPSGSLSNELDRSGGVLQPPATGDKGVVPPPKAGPQSTPVIPPPGTPGGNQEIQPK